MVIFYEVYRYEYKLSAYVSIDVRDKDTHFFLIYNENLHGLFRESLVKNKTLK